MSYQCKSDGLRIIIDELLDVYELQRPVFGRQLAERMGFITKPLSRLSGEKAEVVRMLAPKGSAFCVDDGSFVIIDDDTKDVKKHDLDLLRNIGFIIFCCCGIPDDRIAGAAQFFAEYCVCCDSGKETV